LERVIEQDDALSSRNTDGLGLPLSHRKAAMKGAQSGLGEAEAVAEAE
jgi:hypothetical protein